MSFVKLTVQLPASMSDPPAFTHAYGELPLDPDEEPVAEPELDPVPEPELDPDAAPELEPDAEDDGEGTGGCFPVSPSAGP